MEMNRMLQKEILSFVFARYPHRLSRAEYNELASLAKSGEELAKELLYLEGHGLIAPEPVHIGGNRHVTINYSNIKLTSKGIDFLAKDGGLGAILNLVTVQIHEDSLARIEDFLLNSSLPQPEKQKFLSQLKSLPADATKHVVLKLMELGLENVPAALQLLQKALS